MSFHYVDRIFDIKAKQSISGLKNITRNENFFYWLPTGQRVLSPAVITESMAQLGSWLSMYSTDFTKRPVILADECTTYHAWAESGEQLHMQVEIIDFDDDVIVSKGEARIGNKLIASSKCARGYLLPIEQFDDRREVVRQFNSIYRPELKDAAPPLPTHTVKLDAIAGKNTWDSLRFIDGLITHLPYEKVVGYKNFAASEPYFATHFPYKPVVPGVLLLTFMGEVCQFLLKEDVHMPLRARALVPTHIQNVRFRKFVEPGDQCVLSAEVIKGQARSDSEKILVAATIHANGNRVMQAEMGFCTMYGSNSRALEVFKST